MRGGPTRAGQALAASDPERYCPNCERSTAGLRFRGECGQDRGHPSRSLPLLVAEAVAAFFSVDGRTTRTVRRLLVRPGR